MSGIKVHKNNDDFPHKAWNELRILSESLHGIASGKSLVVDVSIASIISGGHLLIEDVPGVGKSTFIKALAKLSGLSVSRIQCTSDMLPSDMIGSDMFDPKNQQFSFHKGPIFSELVFIDELNRAPPKTQSALLEAMGEGQVSIDKKTFKLPDPFVVFATQNYTEQYGTYPLPESQLDRFSAKVRFGYPEAQHELDIFRESVSDPTSRITQSVIDRGSLNMLSSHLDKVFVSDSVAKYVKRFVDATRSSPHANVGVSTRGGLSWVRMSKAIALMRQRNYLIPDDLQYFATCCLSHRIVAKKQGDCEKIIGDLLEQVQVT